MANRFTLFYGASTIAAALWMQGCGNRAAEEPPYNAMAELVGDVSHDSALVHTRLTAKQVRNNGGYVPPGSGHGMRPEELKAIKLPEGMRIAQLDGAVPGKAGRARLLYGTAPDLAGASVTEWVKVGPRTDFTHRFALKSLRPDMAYYYAVETAGTSGGRTRRGAIRRFRTAPAPGDWAPVKFTVITGQDYICHDIPEGYKTYVAMRRLAPDFLVSTGDSVYYDTETPRVHTIDLARHHWHRMYSMPALVDFFSASSGYWQKDDHDTFEDDCWRTRPPRRVDPLTYDQLAPVFAEQVPVGPIPYRSFRWGKGLEIWLMESRDFRSPNPASDGPEKSLWGKEQKEWMKRTVQASDAQYRVVISPTPIVGPDELGRDYFQYPGGNGDNHTNKSYGTEGNEIRSFFGQVKPRNLYEICGDRHWQYFSVDPKTGMHEFSTGPVSDTHTVKPFPADPRYHRFLRFAGGFLSVSLEGSREKPLLAFRFHDTEGKALYEFVAGK